MTNVICGKSVVSDGSCYNKMEITFLTYTYIKVKGVRHMKTTVNKMRMYIILSYY